MRRRGIWIAGALAVVLGAAIGVHASSAAPARVGVGAATTNATYSCLVGQQRSVNVYGSVTLPPQDGRQQPGLLVVTTGAKTSTKNGVTTTVSQVGIGAKKSGLKIDKSSCSRVKHQIPLKPKGLPGPDNCDAEPVRPYQRGLRGQVPRDRSSPAQDEGGNPDARAARGSRSAKKRLLAFFEWTPGKVTAYDAASCSQVE